MFHRGAILFLRVTAERHKGQVPVQVSQLQNMNMKRTADAPTFNPHMKAFTLKYLVVSEFYLNSNNLIYALTGARSFVHRLLDLHPEEWKNLCDNYLLLRKQKGKNCLASAQSS